MSKKPLSFIADRLTGILDRAETVIYALVAAFLVIGALVLVVSSAWHFVEIATSGSIEHAALRALEDLLLVIMLVEIVHTVGISMRRKQLICEPFLVVGVIAAVRRMLIITAEMATPTAEEADVFKLAMLELGLLTLTIVALAVGIYLLRRPVRGGSDSGGKEIGASSGS